MRDTPNTYDRVGNRLAMAESNGTGQRLTTYQYDEHDRLTRQTSSGPSLDYTASLDSDDGTAFAEVWTPPSRVAVYCLIAFATLTLGALFVPLRLLRSRRPDLGREVRRRRTWIQTIALALIPLMVIGPEAALAIHNEALLYQAVAAAAAGQTAQYETTYTYDANGNMVTRTVTNGGSPATDTYIYDAQNRLVAAELNVGEMETIFVSYGYDADGIRNRVTKNGVTTWHLTDTNRDYAQVLAEHNGTGQVYVRYCYGDDLISQTRDPSGSNPATRFYHYDGQLSTRQMTDSAGALLADHAYTYDAFGNLVSHTPATLPADNTYLYTGEQHDTDLGFYYLRARYYAQRIGRFASRDPFDGVQADPLTLHKYMYAHANPVCNSDPTGQWSITQTLAVAVILTHLLGPYVAAVSNVLTGGSFIPDAAAIGFQITGELTALGAAKGAIRQLAKCVDFLSGPLLDEIINNVTSYVSRKLPGRYGMGGTFGGELLALASEKAMQAYVYGGATFSAGLAQNKGSSGGITMTFYRAVIWDLPSFDAYEGSFYSASLTASGPGVGVTSGFFVSPSLVRAWHQGVTLQIYGGSSGYSLGLAGVGYTKVGRPSRDPIDVGAVLSSAGPWWGQLLLRSAGMAGTR